MNARTGNGNKDDRHKTTQGFNNMQKPWPIKYFIVAVFGGTTSLAFAPFQIPGVIFISLAVLLYLSWYVSPAEGFKLGWVFGFSFFATGVHWIYTSMHDFGHIAGPVASLIVVLFAALLGLFPALSVYLTRQISIHQQHNHFQVINFAVVWVVLEWVRSWFLTGFPWLSVGYAQSDNLLRWWFPIAGIYGASFVTVILASVLSRIMLCKGRCWGYSTTAVILVLISSSLADLGFTRPTGERITVALLQGNVSQDIKWQRSYRKQQLQWYRDKTRQNIDADLIVWPETAIPALAHQVKTFLEELDLWAGQHDQGIILGVPVLDQTVMYNSMIGLGRAQGIYRKMHLVPLGEYFPLKSILRLLPGLDIPLSDMQPGESAQKGIVFDNQNTAISICYEDVFAGEMMPWVQNSGFLINASNDAWFGDLAPYQHLQMARMRALESGRPMIRATNTGISAFIDEKGWVIHQSKLNQAEVLKSEVQYFQGETPYMLIKDYWVILFCALFLLSGYLPMLKKIEDRCQLAIKTVNK